MQEIIKGYNANVIDIWYEIGQATPSPEVLSRDVST